MLAILILDHNSQDAESRAKASPINSKIPKMNNKTTVQLDIPKTMKPAKTKLKNLGLSIQIFQTPAVRNSIAILLFLGLVG